jgi:hypothetical protein
VPCHNDRALFEMLILEGPRPAFLGRRSWPSARTIAAPSLPSIQAQSPDLRLRTSAALLPIRGSCAAAQR